MFLLDWRLAVFSLILLPFFVWLTRRVGEERRRIQSVRQSRLADMSTLVEESLSVSGILLGKTMGRSPELVRRFSDESGELADLEVRARMAGRWRMATVQMSFAIMPAARLPVRGVARPRRPRDLDRHGRRVHDPADAAAVPDPVAAVGRASKCRPRSPCSGGSSSTWTCPSTSSSAPAHERSSDVRGDVRLEDVWFRYAPEAPWTLAEIDAEIPAGHAHRARRRDGLGQDHARLSRRAPVRARAGLREHRRRRHPRHDPAIRSRAPSASSPRRPTCSTPRSARTSASPVPRRATRRSKRPRAPRRSTG